MKLLLKIFGYTFLGLIGLVVIALIAVQFISDEQYKKWIAGAAESATGRELTIDGELDVSLGMKVGLLAENVRFANADWGSRDNMVTAERLFVQVPLLPLFKGVLDVTLEVDTPDILLETDTEGNGNWAFGEPSAETEEKSETGKEEDDGKASGLPIKPYIRNLEINNLSFVFNDQVGGTDIDADMEQLRIFVDGEQIPLTLKAHYQGAPIVLDGSLGNIEQWHNNEQTALSVKGSLNEAQLVIEGTVGPVLPQPQAKINIALNADNINTFSDFAGIAIPDLKELNIAFTTVASEGRLSTENIRVALNDPRLMVDVTGQVDDLTEHMKIDLQAAINSDSANELLSGLDQQVDYTLPSTVTLNAAIQGDLSELSISDLELMVKDEGLELSLTGGLENVLAPEGGDVELQMQLDSTALIGEYIGQEIPDFGPLSGTAKLSSAGEHVQLESLVLDLSDPLISAKITGSASDIGRDADNNFVVNDIVLNGDVGSENLKGIAEKFSVTLPGELPASFTLHAVAAGNLSELGLQELKASVLDDGIDVNLTGTVQNLIGLKDIEANFSGKVADTSQLSKFAGMELPNLGSLDLQGQVVSTEDSYRLNNLDVKLAGEQADVQVKAAIEDLIKLTKVNAVVDGNLASLASLSDLAQAELPQTGPWKVHITANSENLMESPLTLAAKLGGEGVDAAIDAELPDIKAPQTFQTDLAVDIESLARVLALLDREIPEDKTLKIVASASGKPGEYHLNEFSVKAKDSEIFGDLAYLVPPAGDVERKSLTGAITINNFDFTPFIAQKEEEAEDIEESEAAEEESEEVSEEVASAEQKVASEDADSAEGASSDAKDQVKKIFPDEPLTVGVLHEYDVDVKIKVSEAITYEGTLLSANIAVSLDDGYLSIDPFELDQDKGGTGDGYIHLDTRGEDAILDVALNLDNFVSPRFGGLLNFDIDLDSNGQSVAALMANLNGHFAASLKDVELIKTWMSQFGAGLLSNLNPLDSEKTILECAVVRFDIEDGIADFHKKIAAQTSEVTWMGGGEIDLKTEELDLGIAPKARGAISSLTNVGLASLVHVGGTLAEPKIGIDVADVAKKYAGYSAFIATGGLSFLAQKLVETTQANVDQCERILKDLEEK